MARAQLTALASFGLPRSSVNYVPPLYLAPAFASLSLSRSAPQLSARTYSRPFSSSRGQCLRKRSREKNKSRGVSAIRRTGPRVPLSISKYDLPRPVIDPPARKEFKTDPDHGLWAFFNQDKVAMSQPEEDFAHGRAWTHAELSYKSFEDLHGLFWVCVKERNRISTSKKERDRVHAGYGEYESGGRKAQVAATMKGIKSVLRDRFHAWEEARAILAVTPVVNLELSDGEDMYEGAEDVQSLEETESDQSLRPSEGEPEEVVETMEERQERKEALKKERQDHIYGRSAQAIKAGPVTHA